MINIDLSGKTAVVTGASQGLGAATATMLHSAGCNVVVNYLDDTKDSNRGNAEALVEQLGERAVAIAADVCQRDQLRKMFAQAIEHFSSVDIVVNNAGILRDQSFKKMSSDQWQQVIDVNLTGVFNSCKEASEVLADGGRIVNLASVSAVIGIFGQANYCAAKSGVIGLTKVLSKELGRRQINVNAVAPGVVMTEMGQSIPQAARDQMLSTIPLGRFGEPDDIAAAILFLCSPMAQYITGQVLHVNGGMWG